MRAVDTNVLVRLLVRDDTAKVQAAAEFLVPGAWVPLLVLAQAAWVLSSVYGRSANQIAEVMQTLVDHEQLTLQDHEVVAAALNLFRANPSLSFSDCLILETSRKAGHIPLGTFDRKLARLPGAQQLARAK